MVHCIAPSDRHHGHVCSSLGKHMGQRWCHHHHDKAKKDYLSYKKDEVALHSSKDIQRDTQAIQLLESIISKRKAFQQNHVHIIHQDDAHHTRIQDLSEKRNDILTQTMSDLLGMNSNDSDDCGQFATMRSNTNHHESNDRQKQDRTTRSQRRKLAKQIRKEELEFLDNAKAVHPVPFPEPPPSMFEIDGLALLYKTPSVELYTFTFVQVLHRLLEDQKKKGSRSIKHSEVMLALIKSTAFALSVSKEIMLQKLGIDEDVYDQFAAHIGFIQFLVCESRACGIVLPLTMSFISLLGKAIGDKKRDSVFERKICMILLKTQSSC